MVLATMAPVTALGDGFYDNFEAPVLDSFWEVSANRGGTVALVGDRYHSSGQAVRLEIPTSNALAAIIHELPRSTQGTFSVWLYETRPTQQYCYFELLNRDVPEGQPGFYLTMGILDWDGNFYRVRDPGTTDGWVQTNIPRIVDRWRHFEIDIQPSQVTYRIDGTAVATFSGTYAASTVILSSFDGSGAGSFRFYFDDFSMLLDMCGDWDGNGVVALGDLTFLLGHFGVADGPVYDAGDMTGDGDVDLADLTLLLSNFGTTCP